MYKKYLKRVLDFFISLILLILLSPLLLILMFVVRINMGTPIFFKQARPGKNGKLFNLYKFRSMSDKKDENGNLLPDEKRLTKFGKFLRSTSLDELPELLNILKGEMSFVGPRPLLVQYLPLYNERQRHRHDVRPGLTGLAQITGRNLTPWKEYFEYDIEYVENLSFMNDLRILFKTISVVLTKKGATPEDRLTREYFTGNEEG